MVCGLFVNVLAWPFFSALPQLREMSEQVIGLATERGDEEIVSPVKIDPDSPKVFTIKKVGNRWYTALPKFLLSYY